MSKPPGFTIYSTCSVESEENEDVIAGFLAGDPMFSTVTSNVPDRFITDDGFVRTWPHRDEMDGFFVASLRKS